MIESPAGATRITIAMAKKERPKETWNRLLSPDDFIEVATMAQSLVEKAGQVKPTYSVELEGATLEASSAPEIREDLEAQRVRDDEIGDMHAHFETAKVTVFFMVSRSFKNTSVQSSGADGTRVLGVHAQLVREINRRFKERDREAEKLQSASPAAAVLIGSMHGGNVAVSGTGSATASSE